MLLQYFTKLRKLVDMGITDKLVLPLLLLITNHEDSEAMAINLNDSMSEYQNTEVAETNWMAEINRVMEINQVMEANQVTETNQMMVETNQVMGLYLLGMRKQFKSYYYATELCSMEGTEQWTFNSFSFP